MFRGQLLQALFFLAMCSFSQNSIAQENIYYTGTGLWSETSKWTPQRLPNAMDTVIIKGTAVTINQSASIAKLVLSNEGAISSTLFGTGMSGGLLEISGNLEINGYNNNTDVEFWSQGTDSIYVGGNIQMTRSWTNVTDKALTFKMSAESKIHVNGDFNYTYNGGGLEVHPEVFLEGNAKLHVHGEGVLRSNGGDQLSMYLTGNSKAFFHNNLLADLGQGYDLLQKITDNAELIIAKDYTILNQNTSLLSNHNTVEVGDPGGFVQVGENLNLISAIAWEKSKVKVISATSSVKVLGDILFDAQSESDVILKIHNGAVMYHGGNFSLLSPEKFGDLKMDEFSEWWLVGSSPQSLPDSDHATNGSDKLKFTNIIFNNTCGTPTSLTGPLVVEKELRLMGGVISSTSEHPVILMDDATVSGGKADAYVDGPIVKSGTFSGDSYLLPTGDAGTYAPIELVIPKAAIEGTYTVEYLTCPPPLGGQIDNASLTTVSGIGHWEFERSEKSTEVDIALHWDNANYYGITDLSDLTVAIWDGDNSHWKSIGNGGTTGSTGNSSGSILNLTCPPPLGAQRLAFGSVNGTNPLPVVLTDFQAKPKGEIVEVSWNTTAEFNSDYFVIERSTNGINFQPIGKVEAQKNADNLTEYLEKDLNPQKGANYYRLCQVDNLGMKVYSRIVLATFEATGTSTVFPNPVIDELFVKGDFEVKAYDIQILDASGKEVSSQTIMGEDGLLSLSAQRLNIRNPGVYFIKISNDTQIQTLPLIKH